MRAHPAGVLRHAAVPGEDQQGGRLQFVGHDDGAFDELLARLGELGRIVKLRTAAAFDARGNLIEHFDALQGVFADRGLAAQHDGIRLLEDGIGDVGDFGARGHGRFNHAFQHVGGNNHRPADPQAGLHDAALDDGQLFVGDFNAQIAARHHDAVRLAHDRFQVFDGLLILNLSDDKGMRLARLKHFAQLEQVAGLAHE